MSEDIVHVILRYVPLKSNGHHNFIAHCPFHKERSPSFSVNPLRQIWHCFGCHAGGDAAAFIKAWESRKPGKKPSVKTIPNMADKVQLLCELDMANQRIRDLEAKIKQMEMANYFRLRVKPPASCKPDSISEPTP